MTGTLSQTALGTFPIFYFLDVLLETCSLFFYVTLFILLLVSYIYIFFFILTLDLCRASHKTTLCDVGSLLKDLIYYYYYKDFLRLLLYEEAIHKLLISELGSICCNYVHVCIKNLRHSCWSKERKWHLNS